MKRLELLMLVLLTSVWLPSCIFAEQGTAVIKGTQPNSLIAGQVTLTSVAEGLRVHVTVNNAPPGRHGMHVHEKGSCEQVGDAAGGHYNPENVKHGFLPTDGFSGAHAGDLGNIQVAPDGTGTLELTIPGLSLTEGPHSVNGRAVILHEKEDNFGQPTGNAGGRIGCGVITVAGQ